MQYIILSMKVDDEQYPSMSLGCKKRLRPLAPKLCEAPSLDLTSLETGGSRWNPTQEQIGILEMVYKRGMRTPNTQQIQQITEQLSKYGRIQGKNVFYWFQNHKARERQKQKRNGGLSQPSPTSSLITITIDDNNNNKKTREEETPNKRKFLSWAFDQCLEEEQEESTITTISTSTRAGTRWWLSCKDNEQRATLELFPLHPQGR